MSDSASTSTLSLETGGIRIDGQRVPLLAGAVHYWRLDPAVWRTALRAVAGVGFRLVDVYVPWGVHERAPGELEMGGRDPRLDLPHFLTIAQEEGLFAIVRPGPHINAELTFFGLPERVVWDPACQARSPNGNPVMLPILPRFFPVPSYASDAYQDEVRRYFGELGKALAPLIHPHGPIVLLQIDNEGAMYFRDGVFDQDHHPDALSAYRDFLRDSYGSLDALAAAHGVDGAEPPRFATAVPPRAGDLVAGAKLAPFLDWTRFQEHMLTLAMKRFGAALEEAGLSGVPTMHNLPPAQHTTPLDPLALHDAVDMVGLDYYARASRSSRRDIMRRTSAMVAWADAAGTPAYACELGAGFPPFFPPLGERDSEFVALCALAYGLRGFNLYMAVERDRWIGSPIDAEGVARPWAGFWRRLCEAIDAVDLPSLRRRVNVQLVVPREERRLQRLLHVFGPASAALFASLGQGPAATTSEAPGLPGETVMAVDRWLGDIERALEARGVAFGWSESVTPAGPSVRWVVVASSGDAAFERVPAGVRTTRFDASRSAEAEVDAALEALQLTPESAPGPHAAEVHTTVFEDHRGVTKARFAINPSDEVRRVPVTFEPGRWREPLEARELEVAATEPTWIELPPRSVRMFTVDADPAA